MRLIDLDAIMAQFPKADFDGDVIENTKAYPYWAIGIDGLINVLKAVPIIEQSEDCVSRDEVLKDQLSVYTKEYGEIDVVAVEYIESLPSVTPSYNSIKTELKPCEDCISREAAIDVVRKWFDKVQLNGDICLDGIISLPSVTPSIPDVENNFNLGYNCGYAYTMSDIAESEE